MAQLRNNFQGLGVGTTLTTGNSGGASGNAFDVVTAPPAGGTLAGVGTPLMHGPVSLGYSTTTTTGLPSFGWSTSMGTKSQIWGRVYFYTPTGSFPATTIRCVNFASGATQCASIAIDTTGHLRIRNNGTTDLATTTNAVPLDAWCRVEWRYQFSTTTGNAQVDLYLNPDSATPTESISASGGNFGAASADTFTFGCIATGNPRGPFYMADLALDDTALPGPSLLPPDLATARYSR